VAETVRLLNEAKVPCSPIMTSKDMAEDPQYRARRVHIEWEDEQVGRVKGIGLVPKFSLTPGKVFRGAVGIGHDNRRVYGELLGLADAEIASLERDKVI
jgi:crotonobetainyl-CoA:carnitine CoA-transferase CaiB-like acyl-CoA transferase